MHYFFIENDICHYKNNAHQIEFFSGHLVIHFIEIT